MTPNDPRQEDFDDYVVECDEHLAAARRSLLDLESVKELASVGREPLDALFRAFHTVKGLSGMVGAREAEEAAHVLENYLVAVRSRDTPLTEEGVDALFEGVGLIETAVSSFRMGAPPPDVTPLAERVGRLLPKSSDAPSHIERVETSELAAKPGPANLTAEKRAKLDAAILHGDHAWWVVFSPSSEMAAQGVNVGVVRGWLQSEGEILLAEPVPAPGGVIFRFLVTTPADFDPAKWKQHGVAVERYQLPAEETADAAHRTSAGIVPSNVVRVDLRRLDDLMRTVGELVLSRARLEASLKRIARSITPQERRELDETAQTIERQLRDLREEVMRARMVPVRDLFARMQMVVRELARATGKNVDLVVSGEETEVDKFVVERMADPFLHLVRNAVSHGLESAAERTAAGKPPEGRLALRAFTAGGMIILEVEDDGRGVRTEEVFARARDAGLISPDAPSDPGAVLDVLCTPGFSTRDEADRASGRGVGMDVVRLAVEGLGGTLSLDAQPGVGSRFTARLPLTLVIADVLTIAVGGQTYAVPQTAVREVVEIEPGSTTTLENNELIRYRGGAIPLMRLGDAFGSAQTAVNIALVTGEGANVAALGADRAIGLREVVVRALADPLIQAPGFSGATELGDGRPILILDPVGLARLARRRAGNAQSRDGE